MYDQNRVSVLLGALVLAAATCTPAAASELARPPAQPGAGPGGAAYRHKAVSATTYRSGSQQYWLFEPDEPRADRAPLVAFLHGWSAMEPEPYLGWIHHLVRQGFAVVYPRYQKSLRDKPSGMTAAAARAIRDALRQLDGRRHVRWERGRLVLVGHSLGGVIAANLAAASRTGLPRPRALMIVEPADTPQDRGTSAEVPSIVGDYETIDPETAMTVVVGADDTLAGEAVARQILDDTPQVPPGNKSLVVVNSDRHGTPALVADHYAPLAPIRERTVAKGEQAGEIDALDYYGFWRLCDDLVRAAFGGGDREPAQPESERETWMGAWSDGVPVAPLTVIRQP